jgi:hypothetical protein
MRKSFGNQLNIMNERNIFDDGEEEQFLTFLKINTLLLLKQELNLHLIFQKNFDRYLV